MNERFEMENILTSVKPIHVPESVTAGILAALNASRESTASTIPISSTRRWWLRADFVSFASAVCFLIVSGFGLVWVNSRNGARLYSIYDKPPTAEHMAEFQGTIVEAFPLDTDQRQPNGSARDLRSNQPKYTALWDFTTFQITSCTLAMLNELNAEKRSHPSPKKLDHNNTINPPDATLFFPSPSTRSTLIA